MRILQIDCFLLLRHNYLVTYRDLSCNKQFSSGILFTTTSADDIGIPDLAAFTIVVVGDLYRLAAGALEVAVGSGQEAILVIVPFPACHLVL